MNNEQAKFILGAYRPSGRDAGDATFGEALRQAQLDPALGAWLVREQGFDTKVAAKLRAIVPPPGLREAILTGAHMSTLPAGRMVHSRWRPAAWLAVAASVAALISLVATQWYRAARPGPAGLDQLARFALAEPLSAHTGPHADKLGALGAWLENPANRMVSVPPVDLTQLKAQGCRTVSIAGHEVFEICFQRNGGWYHLYFARRSDFAASAGDGVPAVLEQGGRSVATWAGQQLAFALMTGGGAEALRRVL